MFPSTFVFSQKNQSNPPIFSNRQECKANHFEEAFDEKQKLAGSKNKRIILPDLNEVVHEIIDANMEPMESSIILRDSHSGNSRETFMDTSNHPPSPSSFHSQELEGKKPRQSPTLVIAESKVTKTGRREGSHTNKDIMKKEIGQKREEEKSTSELDTERCNRRGGGGWRCKNKAMEGRSHCKHHLECYRRHRQSQKQQRGD